MKEILVMIQDTNNIFGTSLVCRKWKDIIGRKEYTLFKRNATKIITLAFDSLMFCPDVILEHDTMKIRFAYEDRYVVFFLNRYEDIDIAVGKIDGERKNSKWTHNSNMMRFSDFLFCTHKLKGYNE